MAKHRFKRVRAYYRKQFKNTKASKKATNIARRRQLRVERRYITDSIISYVKIVLGIIALFVLLRVLSTPNYNFSIFYFIEQLATMPQISIVGILSWNLGFPTWLSWAENLITIISFLGACLVNLVMVLTWLLKFLFIG